MTWTVKTSYHDLLGLVAGMQWIWSIFDPLDALWILIDICSKNNSTQKDYMYISPRKSVTCHCSCAYKQVVVPFHYESRSVPYQEFCGKLGRSFPAEWYQTLKHWSCKRDWSSRELVSVSLLLCKSHRLLVMSLLLVSLPTIAKTNHSHQTRLHLRRSL